MQCEVACLDCFGVAVAILSAGRGTSRATCIADSGRSMALSTHYRWSVALSAILVAADRYLSVKAGHAPAGYEYIDPNVRRSPL